MWDPSWDEVIFIRNWGKTKFESENTVGWVTAPSQPQSCSCMNRNSRKSQKVQSWSIIRKWRPKLTPPLRLWRRLVSEATRSIKIRRAQQTQPSWAPANSSSDKEVCDFASQCLASEICVLDVSGAGLLLCPAHLIKRPVAISCSKLD